MALSVLKREYDHHTEQIHSVGGPSVRDIMLGLNDGLIASFAVTSGVAGAFSTPSVVVMAGLAEMLGGAVSMGLAAYASARAPARGSTRVWRDGGSVTLAHSKWGRADSRPPGLLGPLRRIGRLSPPLMT